MDITSIGFARQMVIHPLIDLGLKEFGVVNFTIKAHNKTFSDKTSLINAAKLSQ